MIFQISQSKEIIFFFLQKSISTRFLFAIQSNFLLHYLHTHIFLTCLTHTWILLFVFFVLEHSSGKCLIKPCHFSYQISFTQFLYLKRYMKQKKKCVHEIFRKRLPMLFIIQKRYMILKSSELNLHLTFFCTLKWKQTFSNTETV